VNIKAQPRLAYKSSQNIYCNSSSIYANVLSNKIYFPSETYFVAANTDKVAPSTSVLDMQFHNAVYLQEVLQYWQFWRQLGLSRYDIA
jgi:hypothetical protein